MKQVKIFRGTCADVERMMNEWLATTSTIDVFEVRATEADTNTLTVIVVYAVVN